MSGGVLFVGPLDRVLFLRTLPILEGLAPAYLAAIAQHARERFFKPGACLLRPDQSPDAVHLIVRGEVDVTHSSGAVSKLSPGEAVGFFELLSRSRSGLTARAATETTTLEFDWNAQLDVCEEHFPVLMQYIAFLAKLTVHEIQAGAVPLLVGDVAAGPPAAKAPLNLVERLLVLHRSQAFSAGCLDALAELAHHVAVVHWRADERIWARGDHADHFTLICSGQVRCDTEDGRSTLRRAYAPVGMHETLYRGRRWHEATSVGPSVALRIEVEPFVDMLEDHFDLALDFLASLARSVLELRRPRTERQDS